jgi:hypothetical protein
MEDLLTATLALDTTVTTKSKTATPRLKSQASEDSQLNEPQLMQEKWKFTVAFLMLGIS